MENPLAADGPAADIELQEVGPFPLTLNDMFTNSYVVEARPEMPVHEVKELVRDVKKEDAEGKLAAAREGLAQLEAEAARAQAKPELAALEARKAESAGQIARLEEQVREVESVEFLDAALLLYDGQPLDDDSTVGSHGLSRTTTVTLSNQDARKGRARREERADREQRERKKREARELLVKRPPGKAKSALLLLLIAMGYGVLFLITNYVANDSCRRLDCGANGQCVVGVMGGYCACESNFIGQFCETECGCSGHGNQTAIEAEREAGSCYSCTCEGNWAGRYCQDDCGNHGKSDGSTCTCESGYVGEFCETYYPPINLSTVPAQCAAGMGSHGVVYNGTAYRTLDDAPPEGGHFGPPNDGCQRICTQYYTYSDGTRLCRTREPNPLPLPPGYALAPPDADTITVIAAHGWSTGCAVTADGAAWHSANHAQYGGTPGDRCGYGYKLARDDMYSGYDMKTCEMRVLARCP